MKNGPLVLAGDMNGGPLNTNMKPDENTGGRVVEASRSNATTYANMRMVYDGTVVQPRTASAP